MSQQDLAAAVRQQDLPELSAVLAAGRLSGDDLGDALTDATDNGWVADIMALLGAGADPNWHPPDAPSGFPLAQAIYWLWIQAVEVLLDAGADLEARNYTGRTPLYQAIFTEVDLAAETPPSADLTALLVRHGADVLRAHARGADGCGPRPRPRAPARGAPPPWWWSVLVLSGLPA